MCDKFELEMEAAILGEDMKCCGNPTEGDSRYLRSPLKKVAVEWEIEG